MSTKIKRSNFKTFMDVNPSGTASYQLIGDGHKTGLINYNPKDTEEQYINQDTASVSLDGYAPTMPLEMTALEGDAIFELVDSLRKARSIGADAQTTIVHVWYYEGAVSGTYPAEQQSVILEVDTFGGDAGNPVQLNYTLKYNGDHTVGRYNPSSGTFAAVVW